MNKFLKTVNEQCIITVCGFAVGRDFENEFINLTKNKIWNKKL